MSAEPIHGCLERWHRHTRGELDGGLDSLLHEDCVFLSPIVFTPQRGRDITKLYLRAAGSTLADADPSSPHASLSTDSSFGYTKEIRQGHHAMLEFETEIEGKYANGVDIISCDDDGMIVEFKVMMRPLQAINAVHAQMKAMLEQLAEMVDDGELAELVRRTAHEARFSGAVRVDHAGRTAATMAFGLADRRSGIANDPSTRFCIASGTKGLTALTVMSLVADDVLSLGTTARSLLGDDLPLIDDTVTVEHLIAHRSGIGDYLDESTLGDINDYVMPVPVHQLADVEDYLAVLDGFPQREPPGETFRYNNGGFVVLSLLAERAAGRAFDDLVHERVVLPAGMASTGFDRGDELPGDVAIGYLHDDGLRSNVLHLPVRGAGDGGIITTVDDVHRLWQAFFDDEIVDASVRDAMIAPRSEAPEEHMRYGLGFWLHPTSDAVILVGMDAGVSFRTVHDPASATTHTTVANTSSGAWPVTKALDEALGLR